MDFFKRYKLDSLLLPLIGLGAFLLLWLIIAGRIETRKSVDDFGDPVTGVRLMRGRCFVSSEVCVSCA